MAGDLHLPPDPRDAAFGVDQERRALDAHELAAIHALLGPDAVGLRQGLALIGEKRQIELVLQLEAIMSLGGIGRDSDDLRRAGGKFRAQPVEVDRLASAAGRVVLRVGVEHELAPTEALQRDFLTTVTRQPKIRRPVTFLQNHGRLPSFCRLRRAWTALHRCIFDRMTAVIYACVIAPDLSEKSTSFRSDARAA